MKVHLPIYIRIFFIHTFMYVTWIAVHSMHITPYHLILCCRFFFPCHVRLCGFCYGCHCRCCFWFKFPAFILSILNISYKSFVCVFAGCVRTQRYICTLTVQCTHSCMGQINLFWHRSILRWLWFFAKQQYSQSETSHISRLQTGSAGIQADR